MSRSGGTFSVEEVRYLKQLPAVANVTRKRITYADAFKRNSLRRYLAGESPVRLFREAGLDPALIGYKRIERCFSRWKDQYRRYREQFPDDDRESPDLERATAAIFNSRGLAGAGVRAGSGADAGASNGRVSGDGSASGGDSGVSDGPVPGSAIVAGGGGFDVDVRSLIIAQQARRIDELEREITALRMQMRQSHTACASTPAASDPGVCPR